jgi:ornithine carbamoyltransferase
MNINLSGKSLRTLLDFSKEEIKYLLNLSKKLKDEKRKEIKHDDSLKGKNIVILFQKTSTRTRCAFEVAAYDLGMNVTFIGPTDSQMGKKESIKDTARVLARMYDGIEFRGYKQSDLEELIKNARKYNNIKIPVWNGLTDEYHPTQILADFLTIIEEKKIEIEDLKKIKFAYLGDARNNMGTSLMIGAAKMGMHFIACGPKELLIDQNNFNYIQCQKIAKETGAKIEFTTDAAFATKNADVIYTDIWASMGEENKLEERINLLKPYQVNEKLIKNAKKEFIFMHCLPAFHNNETEISKKIINGKEIGAMEVTEEIFESKNSVVFNQAENRLHTIKAIILATMKSNNIKK